MTADTREPAKGWTAEVIALSKSLSRLDRLLQLEGGIELNQITNQLDPRWNRQSGRTSHLALYSPSAWLAASSA